MKFFADSSDETGAANEKNSDLRSV